MKALNVQSHFQPIHIVFNDTIGNTGKKQVSLCFLLDEKYEPLGKRRNIGLRKAEDINMYQVVKCMGKPYKVRVVFLK